MLDFPPWKVTGIWLILIVGVLLSVPSLAPGTVTAHLPEWARNTHVNLGLDLAGGSHLLLEAETGDVARLRIESMEDIVRRELRRGGVQFAEFSTSGGRLSFIVRNSAQLQEATRIVRQASQPAGFGGTAEWTLSTEDGNRIILAPTQAGLNAAIDQAMDSARDVIDRRINALGTLEPTIIRQGSNRIVVQVPGLQDPEALKELIGRTARLEFKLVDLTATPDQIAAGRAPVGSQILSYEEGGEGARIAVQRRAIITGDQIAEARQGFSQQDGRPVVNITFDGTGARRFARVTQENVGRPFAIILDNIVISAPNINEPILGGQAQISGSFTVQSAEALAISLRSGRLPVELAVVEERTVGPDLGADSVRRGLLACLIGTAAVLVFMVIVYGRFGLYANTALVLNIFLIIGIMAAMNATLTLPGIAGFVLTVGAAVDANVLINERIREEQRRGRRVFDAVETGYREAQRAIYDANITNVIAGALMFYFGSGPVRGFAVVLVIGIATSVFTAVTVTRMLASQWLRRRRPTQLVI